MAAFSTPQVRKAIKLALELGLNVAGFEVLSDGGFRVLTTPEKQGGADADLDRWLRSQNG